MSNAFVRSASIRAALGGLAYAMTGLDMPAVVIPPRYFPDTRGREPRNYRNRSKYKPRIDTPKCERKGADND